MFLLLGVLLLLALVVASGEVFLRGAVSIASKFKISSFVLGSVVISIGTISPDLFVSSASAMKGYYDISSGALIGSAIANLLVCIGLASLISGIKYEKGDQTMLFGMRFHLLFLLLFVIFLVLSEGHINLYFSIFLISTAVFFIFSTIKCSNAEKHDLPNVKDEPKVIKKLWLALLFFFAGLAGLGFFSDVLLVFIIQLSEAYEVPKKVIASVIIGLGNSIPEIVTAIVASLNKRSRIIVGNIVGSNILILGGVLGLASLFSNIVSQKPIQVVLPILTLDIPFLLLCSTLFFVLFKIKTGFGRITGLIFIFLYILYILLQLNII